LALKPTYVPPSLALALANSYSASNKRADYSLLAVSNSGRQNDFLYLTRVPVSLLIICPLAIRMSDDDQYYNKALWRYNFISILRATITTKATDLNIVL
jgi:hypothetical protein